MNRLFILTILLLTTVNIYSQRLIRKSSRFYVESQELPERVDPLLSDSWNQLAPYNNLCPIDTATNERSVVGCVATAMSQVMNYWKWPKTYDWNNILNEYIDGAYSQEQADAVAKLSYDCGIAVNMNYSSEASGARSIYQPLALATQFDYDCGVQMYYRDFFTLSEITMMLKNELANNRPVLISGYNKNGGHAFVIDGYDENDWFHTCWGNPDHSDDSWTYLPNMVPDQYQFSPDSPENGFNILQMFTVGIMPSNNIDANGIKTHLFAIQSIKAVTDSINKIPRYTKDKMKITVHDLCNMGWDILDDSISIMIKKGDDIVCPIYTYDRNFLLEEIDDTTYTDTLTLKLPEIVTDGTYTIVPMYKDNSLKGGKEWKEARTCVGTPNYLIASVKGNEVTLSSDTASISYLTLEDVDFPDMIINGIPSDYGFKFKNHGPEMAGRLYIVMENLEGGKSFYLHRQGIIVGKDEDYTVHNCLSKIYATQMGQFNLRVYYESNLFADELIELPLPQPIKVTVIPVGQILLAQNPS